MIDGKAIFNILEENTVKNVAKQAVKRNGRKISPPGDCLNLSLTPRAG